MRRLISGFALLCGLALMPGAPASAQEYRDFWSGLTVSPPPGYSTKKLPANANFKLRVDVLRADDTPELGCRVGFTGTDDNKALTQAGVNYLTRQKKFHDFTRAVFAQQFNVRSSRQAQYGELNGYEIVGDMKRVAGQAANAPVMRAWAVIFLTPKGYASVFCVDEQKRFAKRMAEFRAVARGVRLPG